MKMLNYLEIEIKDRIIGKTLKVLVKSWGKELAIEVSSQAEFDYEIQKSNERIAKWVSLDQQGN